MFTRTPPKRQQGIATVLIVLLIAVSLTAAVLAGIQYNRSAQEQAISLHAQTAAQSKAWEAAEMLREYFFELKEASPELLKAGSNLFPNSSPDDDEATPIINSFDSGLEFNLDGLGGIKAVLQKTWIEHSIPSLQVLISATTSADTRAEATSYLQAIYSFTAETNPGVPSRDVVHFGGDTSITGGINIKVEPGKTYDLFVDGNLTIGSVGVTGSGINSILSTKSIFFNGGTNAFFEKLQANCDIKLSSSSGAERIYATNNICLSGVSGQTNKSSIEVKANGSVAISNQIGGEPWGDVITLANNQNKQFCAEDSIKHCGSPSTLGVALNSNAAANSVTTHGSVALDTSAAIGKIRADGSLNIKNWNSNITGDIGGSCTANSAANCNNNINTGLNPFLPPLPPVLVLQADRETLDVSQLERHANYIFMHDGTKELVDIKNISTIPNDIYSLINKDGNKYFACQPNNSSICHGPIAIGNSISYDKIKDKWTLSNTTMAPGFAIFRGNLDLQTGNYINTFAATGNITSGGNLKIYALNYTGYDGTRANPKIFAGVCSYTLYSPFYPSNLCGTNKSFNYTAIEGYGNYGLLASGDISLNHAGGGSEIFGAVKAGQAYHSKGNTTVHGYVSGLGEMKHNLEAKLEIDLTNLPEGYNPGGSNPSASANNPITLGNALIRWSRYK